MRPAAAGSWNPSYKTFPWPSACCPNRRDFAAVAILALALEIACSSIVSSIFYHGIFYPFPQHHSPTA